jgi:hypothetical protein
MADGGYRNTPWILWPFVALWQLVSFILRFTGRIIGIVIGVVLIMIGGAISLTVIGAVVGIPLMVLGFLLIVRGLF